MNILILLFTVFIYYVTVDGRPGSFITPCKEKDANCLKSSAQAALPVLAAGVPELGLSPLDPMHVGRVQASEAGLDMDFNNTVVKGLRKCIVLGLKRNGNKMLLNLKCSVTLVGDYNLNGKLLILPIEGSGKYKIRIRDMLIKIPFEVSEKTVNGEKYWSFDKWKHQTQVQTSVEFQFQNLFNGNKQLADTIHEFANSNWKDIYSEVAPPIVKSIIGKVVDVIRDLFSKVPLKNLSLD